MININMNSLLESGISRYALVIGVAKRAAQITEEVQKDRAVKGNDYDKSDYGTEKSVTLAVNEYLAKKYDILDPNKRIDKNADAQDVAVEISDAEAEEI